MSARHFHPCARPLAFALLAALTGCAAETVDGSTTLEVRSPVAGVVSVGAATAAVDPLGTVTLAVGPPPQTVHFVWRGDPISIMGVTGSRLDLGAFIETAPTFNGVPIDLTVRTGETQEETAALVAVVGGQVLSAEPDADGWRLHVPDGPSVVLLAVLSVEGRATHLERRVVRDPRLTLGRPLQLTRGQPLEGRATFTLAAPPAGTLVAELTEDGLRTGLRLITARIDGDVAVAVPTPPEPAAESGLWIEIADATLVGEAPANSMSVALPLRGAGADLDWPLALELTPEPRPADAPAFVDRERVPWRLGGLDGAAWIEAQLIGRSGCGERRWRVIAPSMAEFALPASPIEDPLAAPLITGRVAAVRFDGLSREALWTDGLDPIGLPRTTARRSTRGQSGAWRGGLVDCARAPLAGRWFSMSAPEDLCADGQATVVVGRCGEVIPLDRADTPLGCGQLGADTYAVDAQMRWPVTAEADGALLVARPAGSVRLAPAPAPAIAAPSTLRGAWTRYTLREQRLDADGVPVDTPAITGAGDESGGPYVFVSSDGIVRVRTPGLRLRAHLIEAQTSTAVAQVIGVCDAARRTIALRREGDALVLLDETPTRAITLTARR